MGPLSYMRSVDRNVAMQRIPVCIHNFITLVWSPTWCTKFLFIHI